MRPTHVLMKLWIGFCMFGSAILVVGLVVLLGYK